MEHTREARASLLYGRNRDMVCGRRDLCLAFFYMLGVVELSHQRARVYRRRREPYYRRPVIIYAENPLPILVRAEVNAPGPTPFRKAGSSQ